MIKTLNRFLGFFGIEFRREYEVHKMHPDGGYMLWSNGFRSFDRAMQDARSQPHNGMYVVASKLVFEMNYEVTPRPDPSTDLPINQPTKPGCW